MKYIYAFAIAVAAVSVGGYFGYWSKTTPADRSAHWNKFINFFVSTAAAVRNYFTGLFSFKSDVAIS